MKKIIIDDHFLKKEEIELLLSFYNNNKKLIESFESKYLLNLNNNLLNIKNKINNYVKEFSVEIDWWEIVFWPTLTFQNMHYDFSRIRTKLTSISYLNDDYEGGETYFDDGTVIGHVKGRTVFFDGQEYKHGVKKVTKGSRFVMAVWYK